jgi:hypothetical protein
LISAAVGRLTNSPGLIMRIVLPLSVLTQLSLVVLAQSGPALPRFSDYRVDERYLGKVATPLLRTKKDREYKTELREAAQRRPNFAGHYIVTTFGCGAQCVMGAVLDAKTGVVYWIPFTICCWDVENANIEPVAFRPDSRLMIFTGSRNEKGKGVYYYEFTGSRFTSLRAVE